MLSRDLSVKGSRIVFEEAENPRSFIIERRLDYQVRVFFLQKVGKECRKSHPILDEEMKGIESLLLGHHAEL